MASSVDDLPFVVGLANTTTTTMMTSTMSEDDLAPPPSSSSDTPLFTYVVEGVLLLVISLVGCVGNVFAVLGLARNKKTRSFTKLLIALAVFDLLYLVMGIAIFGIPVVSSWYKRNVYVYILPVCYGLAHIGRVGSVLLTLSVSVERYYSVCHPLRQFRAKRHLLPATVIFSVLYNVPKFFEFEIYWPESNENDIMDDENDMMMDGGEDMLNGTLLEESFSPPSATIVTTELRRKSLYVILYVFWSKFLLVELLPYVALIVLNCLIWRRVKKLVNMRNKCGIEPGPVHEEEIELARILISVVSIFILCQSIKIIPDIYEVFTCAAHFGAGGVRKTASCKGNWTIEHIIDSSHCLLAVNSSVNFFIYIIRGGKFRDVILQLFRNIGSSSGAANGNGGNGGVGTTLVPRNNYEMVVMSPTATAKTATINKTDRCGGPDDASDDDDDTDQQHGKHRHQQQQQQRRHRHHQEQRDTPSIQTTALAAASAKGCTTADAVAATTPDNEEEERGVRAAENEVPQPPAPAAAAVLPAVFAAQQSSSSATTDEEGMLRWPFMMYDMKVVLVEDKEEPTGGGKRKGKSSKRSSATPSPAAAAAAPSSSSSATTFSGAAAAAAAATFGSSGPAPSNTRSFFSLKPSSSGNKKKKRFFYRPSTSDTCCNNSSSKAIDTPSPTSTAAASSSAAAAAQQAAAADIRRARSQPLYRTLSGSSSLLLLGREISDEEKSTIIKQVREGHLLVGTTV